MTKEKFGKIAHDLLVKDFQTEDSQKPNLHEQTLEMQQDYHDNLLKAVNHGRGKLSCDDYGKCKKDKCLPFIGDFYIEVVTYVPRLFKNTTHQTFFARKSCPTPNYDQAVFRYNSKEERIEEIWVLGDRKTCYYFIQNTKQIRPDMMQTYEYVKRYDDKSLYRLCKELNGEKEDTPELEKKSSIIH